MLDIEPFETGTGVRVTDTVERVQLALETAEAVSPQDADPESFPHPVRQAFSIRTSALTVDETHYAIRLSERGELVEEIGTALNMGDARAVHEYDPGTYVFDVFEPVKTYLRIEAAEPFTVTATVDDSDVRFDFGTETEVTVGVRSMHNRPAATITTTADPADVMVAISHFGSALKTLGSDRTFPTLRGHPPAVELGDELDVPDSLSVPETGVRLQLPPKRRYIYAAASLAFFLGAELVPGDDPRLVTDSGLEYDLDTPRGVERELTRLLKHTFVCEAVVREGSPYGMRLAERADIEPHLPVDVSTLYERSLGERLEAYLSMSYETVASLVDEWPTGAHVAPTPENVELLPYLAADLAVIQSPATQATAESADALASAEAALEETDFTRGAGSTLAHGEFGPTGPGPDGPASPDNPVTPSTADPDADADSGPDRHVLEPESLDARRQAWAAPGVPIGAHKPTVGAYENALARDPVEGEIEVLVVCNDSSMAFENKTVRSLLGDADGIDLRIRPFHDLRTDELRALIERGGDYLHYIGHIDEEGFVCSDGKLDAASLDSVGVDAFFLNACQSYEQGMALIERGAISGIVTLTDVFNSNAVEISRTVAQLLDTGYPLAAALDLACEAHDGGRQYTLVGDASLTVTQNNGVLDAGLLERTDDGYRFTVRGYFASKKTGIAVTPLGAGIDETSLLLADRTYDVTAEQLETLPPDLPLFVDDEFQWSREFLA